MAAQRRSKNEHLVIVDLETSWVPFPKLELPTPYTYELRDYYKTLPSETAERVRDADIIALSISKLNAEVLKEENTPNLKMVAVVASGTDSVDLESCKARGIHVANTPFCNEGSVAEHTIALYFSVRRSIPLVNDMVRAGEWPGRATPIFKSLDGPDGKPPRLCARETLGIIGYGVVGQKISAIARALGMTVLISGRKGQPQSSVPEGRTAFDTVLRESSALVLSLPRTPTTLNTISTGEFDLMQSHAVLVNISRGGIVDEKALVKALKERTIAGAATDVFEVEPADLENSVLLGKETEGLNLITTPHVAWCADDTNDNYNDMLKRNIDSWLKGEPTNKIV